ncbi:MAG: autotransporter-associated beta strand repeat-containing protein [Verrucomicrobiota bacterium]
MKPKTSLFQNPAKAFAFATAVTLCVAGHSSAAELNWKAATGDFETADNWFVGAGPGTGVPGTLDFANVANGGTAQYTTAAAKTVAEVRAGNGAAGTIQISAATTFTSNGNVHAGRQTGAGTGTLTVSGTGTIFTLATGAGNTLVGSSSADVGTAGSGSTGILNITSGAVYNHNPTGSDTFRIGDNTLAQTGAYKGTLNVDNATLNIPGGRLYVAQTAGSVGEVNVTNNGSINVNNNWIVIGRGGQGKLTLSSGTITKAGANNVAFGDNTGTGVADHTGGTLAINGGELYIGNGANGTGTYNLSGAGAITVANFVGVGRQGGNGTLNITGGTIAKSGANNFVTGAAGGIGLTNHSNGAITVTGGEFIVGNAANSVGTYKFSGGSISVENWMAVGRDSGKGTLEMTGGTITKSGPGSFTIGTLGTNSLGQVDASGGLLNITTGNLLVGEGGTTSTGILNLSGNAVIRAAQTLIGVGGTSTGNLNLKGGTLETGLIDGGTATSNVVFDGTLIKATASASPFISDLTTSVIAAGGMKIDSNGFDLSSSSNVALTGIGGVVKQGLGTLSLLGSNTYEGSTVVNGGKLLTSTYSTGTGAITVADGAGFGVSVKVAGDGIYPSAMTLGASSLDIDLGAFGNAPFGGPTSAPIAVTGALTVNAAAGTIPINLTGSNLTTGTFPVLEYGSLPVAGSFNSFKVGTLPLGVTAVLQNNTTDKTIDLKITVKTPVWTGQNGGAWNTSTVNWTDAAPPNNAVAFADGDPVLFADTDPTGNPPVTTAVTIATGVTVRPGALMQFNNTLLNYSVTGAGKISNPLTGTVGLTKQGTGSLTIGTVNDFTGIVRLEGGSFSVASLANGGVASPIGAATSAPANVLLAGGVLSYTGAGTTTNRGFTVSAPEGGIEVTDAAANLNITGSLASTAGGLVKKGPGTLTLSGTGTQTLGAGGIARIDGGKLVLNGTAATPAQVIQSGEIWVGSTIAAGASLDITNTSFTASSWLAVGRGNGDTGNISSLNISGSTVNVVNFSTGFANGRPNLATQNIAIANSTFTNTGTSVIAENRGSTTNITLTGNTVLNTRELLMAMGGGPAAGASAATLTVGDSSVVNVGTETILSYASIGRDGGTGNLVVKDNGSFLNYDDFTLGEATNSGGTGTITLQDNGVITVRTGLLGRGATNTGLITQTGGTFSNRGDNNMQIGVFGNATWNLSGGIVNANGYTSVGRYGGSVSALNISGTGRYNQLAADRSILVGEEGKGTLTVSGTGQLVAGGALNVGWAGSGDGTINQTGGTISVAKNVVLGDNGKANLDLSGGLFRMNTDGTLNFVVGNFGTGQATLTIRGTAEVQLMNNASLRVGNESTSANNTVTQTGGTLTTYSDNGTTVGGTGAVILGRLTASGTNTYNLTGGTLTVGGVRSETATSTSVFNFKGGTLKAAADSATFMQGLTVVSVEAAGANIDTNSHNITVISALQDAGGAGGLTKTGAGTLTLAGQNTYLGNTAVNAGGITLADDARLRFFIGANGVANRITGTGTAALDGDFNLELGGANITNGNSWTLVDGSVNKTYGASFSVVGFTESNNVWTRIDGTKTWTFSEATSVLTLSVGTGTAYDAWTSTYFPGVTNPAIIGATADPDGDGSSNSLEFALGGVPNNGSNGPKVYHLQADSSADGDTDKELLMTIAVRTGTPAFAGSPSPAANTTDGLTGYTIQGSLDLAGFTTGVTPLATPVATGLPAAPSGYEYRTFSLNGSNNLTGKGFLRVKVN